MLLWARGRSAGQAYDAWRQGLAGRFVLSVRFLRRRVRAGDFQQVLSLRPEATELRLVGCIILGPNDSLVVPFAGFIPVAQLPVRHRQEEPVVAIAAVAQLHRFFKSCNRVLPVAV